MAKKKPKSVYDTVDLPFWKAERRANENMTENFNTKYTDFYKELWKSVEDNIDVDGVALIHISSWLQIYDDCCYKLLEVKGIQLKMAQEDFRQVKKEWEENPTYDNKTEMDSVYEEGVTLTEEYEELLNLRKNMPSFFQRNPFPVKGKLSMRDYLNIIEPYAYQIWWTMVNQHNKYYSCLDEFIQLYEMIKR